MSLELPEDIFSLQQIGKSAGSFFARINSDSGSSTAAGSGRESRNAGKI
jgi:hypothetical protein